MKTDYDVAVIGGGPNGLTCACYLARAGLSGVEQEGFTPGDQTIHHGRRVSAATAYLAPVRGRRNLEIRTGAQATRILFEQSSGDINAPTMMLAEKTPDSILGLRD